MQLRLALLLRVEQILQLHIQRLRAGGPQLCGAEHLNIPDRVKAIAARQAGGNKVAHQLPGRVAVRFQKEEVVGPAALLQRLTADDVVGVFHDQAPRRLPEDLVQADRGHQPGADHLAQNVARPHTGQLVGIAHHDDAAAVAQRCNKGLKQLHIHHAHFVQNDHIALEQVLIVMDKADHAAGVVHLQQTVDGAGLASGQFAQALSCAARGGAQSHPLCLIFQQLQDGVDRSGLAGAGAAGEHKAVLSHGLADGFLLQRCIGKALRQFQDLNVFIQPTGGVFAPFCQHGKPGSNVLLGFQQVGQINIRCAVKQLHPQFFGADALVQRSSQLFRRLMDKIGCRFQQLGARQAGVAVARVVAQGAQQGRFQPLGAVAFHVVILGNAVRVAEIQLQRFAAEQIGICRNGLHGPGPKGAEHFHSPAGADLELSQIGNELPHPEHPLELLLDAVGLIGRDAGHLREPDRVVGDHLQCLSPEQIDDLIRCFGSDIRQRLAGQKGVDSF